MAYIRIQDCLCGNQYNLYYDTRTFGTLPSGGFAYVNTTGFDGCVQIVGTATSPSIPTINLVSIDTDVIDCARCQIIYGANTPCPTSSPTQTPTVTSTPTITPTTTAKPTSTPTKTSTSTVTPTKTSTSTVTPTRTVTATVTSTRTNTPTVTQTPTNTATPTYTPTNTATPTTTPTNTATPTNTITSTITATNTPTPSITKSGIPSISPQPTKTVTSTPSLTPSITPSGNFICPNNSYCIFTNFVGYTQYDGTYYNYGTYNGFSYFYCDFCQTPSFIYYNLTENRWCLSEQVGGDTILFGSRYYSGICPDLDITYSSTICPTPSPSNDECLPLQVESEYTFDLTPDPTPNSTTTPTPTQTQTPTPTQVCVNKFLSFSGYNFSPQSTVTPTPSVTSSPLSLNCIINDTVTFDTFSSNFTNLLSKGLQNCNSSGIIYYVSESVPFAVNSTFNAIINGTPVCVTYIGDYDTSPTNILQEIQSGNLGTCSNCSPILSQTPLATTTPTPTITQTHTPTPSVTPCQLKGVDLTFIVGSGFGGNKDIKDSYILSDGKILICGSFNGYGATTSRYSIIRLNSNGTIDTTFTQPSELSDAGAVMYALKVDEINQSIYVAGYSPLSTDGIWKLDYSGNVDTTFKTNIGTGVSVGDINTIEITSVSVGSATLLVGGSFWSINGISNKYWMVISSSGNVSLPTYSGTLTFDNYVSKIKKMPNGQIVIIGQFSQFNLSGFMHIVKLNSDLTIDATFSSGFDTIIDYPFNLVIDSNNNIYCSGTFSTYQLNNASRLVKIDVNGNFVWGLNSSTGSGGNIFTLQFNEDESYLYIGGVFTSINGVNARKLSKVSTQTGTIDTTFNTSNGFNTTATITTILRQSDNKLIVTGFFSSYKGIPISSIVRLRQCQ